MTKSFWSASLLAILSASLPGVVAAQAPGAGFRVNTYTTGLQDLSRVAVHPDGSFVVVWASDGQYASGTGVFGQRFDASGTPLGSEWRLSVAQGGQDNPVVASGGQGDFIVVWDGGLLGLQGRRHDASGIPVGAEFHVGFGWRPSLAVAPNSAFVVAWQGAEIEARTFDAAGVPTGPAFRVNSYTTGYQLFPDVAIDATGNFVVVWEDREPRDGSGSGIFARRFSLAGTPLGGEFQVNTYTAGYQSNPTVDMSPNGGFVVAWEFPDVCAQRFDAAASRLGREFIVNTVTPGHEFPLVRADAISHDADGNFVVVWPSGPSFRWTPHGQRFDAGGRRRGSEFEIGASTGTMGSWPAVGSDAVGNFVVTWPDVTADGSSTGILARRFVDLEPRMLAVDTTGNHVLEPGETVDIRPTWRNSSGAPHTFSGSFSDVSGPAGATYAITDAAGDYGLVADNTSVTCIDCYAVSVSDPATRPAVHWDASVLETTMPDAVRVQTRWPLHVGGSFSDVPAPNPFYRWIETLLHHGVTAGCTGTTYCPAGSTTREQMAVFVLVAKEGAGYVPPACGTPTFADVPASSPFCRWIEELARRGVVSGCGGGNYCPWSPVSREQMAVFVLRTLDPTLAPPACTTPAFNDVPASSPFCAWIEELARRAVVTGCGGGNYCPFADVTREQMGVFISATFALSLYGP